MRGFPATMPRGDKAPTGPGSSSYTAGLGFLAGGGHAAEGRPSSSKGPQALSFPEVEARFGCCPAHCLLSPAPHPHPCHCQDQGAWKAVSDAQDHGHESRFSERSKEGLTGKARTDGLLGPGQLVLLPYLLQDRQVLCSPRKVWDWFWEPGWACSAKSPGKLSSQVSLAVHLFFSAPRLCEPFPAIRAPRLKRLGGRAVISVTTFSGCPSGPYGLEARDSGRNVQGWGHRTQPWL